MWIFLLLWLLCLPVSAQSRLDEIARRGLLRVGTPGDYAPFSQALDGSYQGGDVDLAALAASRLGVALQWTPVAWGHLVAGLGEDRCDLIVGGVTRTLARARQAGFTRAIVTLGKVPLVRKGEEGRYATLVNIDRPTVRVAFNPGGTNESYARAHFSRAHFTLIEDNLSIPERLARGELDVFVTDSVEAARAPAETPSLPSLPSPGPMKAWAGWLLVTTRPG